MALHQQLNRCWADRRARSVSGLRTVEHRNATLNLLSFERDALFVLTE